MRTETGCGGKRAEVSLAGTGSIRCDKLKGSLKRKIAKLLLQPSLAFQANDLTIAFVLHKTTVVSTA